MNVIEASGLGKRYGSTWALRECSLAIPAGHVAALVGPNGAGKSTLLNLAVGLSAPSAGDVTVLGGRPPGSPAALDGIAFVAQDTPLYKNLSAADMLHLTRNLNRHFDQLRRGPAGRAGHPAEAEGGQVVGWPAGAARADPGAGPAAAAARAGRAGGDARPDRPARLHGHGADGGGRRRRVGAAVLARAGRARRVADYLILMSQGRVQVAGEVDDLLASHRMLTGPAAEADEYAERPVVHVRRGEAQAHLLVRATADDPVPPGWEAHPVGLEELALAYLREPGAAALPGPARGRRANRRR